MYQVGMAAGDDDPSLIGAARRGDHAAWEQLYQNVYPRLRSFLVRKVGRDRAEDAVNETMARAIASISRYSEGPSGFDGWVFGIARHVAADHHRRVARDRRQADVAHLVDGAVHASAPADEQVVVHDDHARLRAAFARLDPAEQEILELRVVAGLSPDQVAAVLDRRPGAVRTAQSRALSHLRRLMELDRVDA